jgi:DNA-binding MarR family transcriptional regulator/lambda repressor-like predicted transcriptional regulator
MDNNGTLTLPELTAASLPAWLPAAVRNYLDHTEEGTSLRALARREGLHASTILRQVRRFEGRREDPLMDEALAALSRHALSRPALCAQDDPARKEDQPMSAHPRLSRDKDLCDATLLEREGRRVLRRLAEPGAVLAIAPEMEKAAVLRDLPGGRSLRTAVLDRAVAQAFALQDWIVCRKTGRVSTYEITPAGRAALRRLTDAADHSRQGLAEAATPFADQHRHWADREVTDEDGPRRVRYNAAESPVGLLGRRLDRDGTPFLAPELVDAAERLREDFELAQMGPRIAQNWDRFLTGGDRGAFQPDSGQAEGPGRARARVAAALRDLGPGLGDVALRCCCFLEGLEVAEKRMGWAARSGKVVLRIALMRLKRHYDETYGRSGPLIG